MHVFKVYVDKTHIILPVIVNVIDKRPLSSKPLFEVVLEQL